MFEDNAGPGYFDGGDGYCEDGSDDVVKKCVWNIMGQPHA
jgi:hypothetical protein